MRTIKEGGRGGSVSQKRGGPSMGFKPAWGRKRASVVVMDDAVLRDGALPQQDLEIVYTTTFDN